MTKKCLLAALMLCLCLFGNPRLTMAQEASKALDNDVLAQLQNEGWHIVKNGLLQRELRAGEVESFVFGPEGFTWKLQDLQRQLRKLQNEFRAQPTPELRKAIASYRQEIANTRKMIEHARVAEALGDKSIEKASCAINFGYDASASSGVSVPGTWGNASANFTGNCGFTGTVYATAYAKVTVNGAPTTKTVTDGPRSGASVSATAYSSLNGGPACESSAYASMTSSSLNPSSYTMSASNPSSCPGQPVTVPVPTINGPGHLSVDACTTFTWTSSISGGTAPFTYQWTWNGVTVSTGSSYSRSICPGLIYNYTNNTLGLAVTDSASRTGSTSKAVAVERFGSGSGCGPNPCP